MKAMILMATVLVIAGCVSVGDALAPSASVIDLGTTKMVIQPPLRSSSDLGQGWNSLGFSWTASNPDSVLLKVETFRGFYNAVSFVADDRPIALTKVSIPNSPPAWAVSMADFQALANAKLVVMRVQSAGNTITSSFGSAQPGALVSLRFAPFLQTVEAVLRGAE